MDTIIAQIEQRLGGSAVQVEAQGSSTTASMLRVQLQGGRELFVKKVENHKALQAEWEGLEALGQCGGLRIPEVHMSTEDYLVTDFITPGPMSDGFWERFAKGLVKIHRCTQEGFGFKRDNFIGLSPQINQPNFDNWADFFYENRLRPQWEWAKKSGYLSKNQRNQEEPLKFACYDLLKDVNEPPSLIHGDLWSGNFLVDASGEAVLIDPAVYFGHREAEFAIAHMFGGFSSDFFEHYDQEWPMQPGWEKRLLLYQLYHYLNHLNIFGTSYLGPCERLIEQLV